MQNRENQEKHPQELVDLAWADMLVRLDEAMPAMPPRKRRRVAAWWWLALGGLVIGSALLGYKYYAMAPPAAIPRPAAALPVGPQAGLAPAADNCPPGVEVPAPVPVAGVVAGVVRQSDALYGNATIASAEITHYNEVDENRAPSADGAAAGGLRAVAASPVVGSAAGATETSPEPIGATPQTTMPATNASTAASASGLLPTLSLGPLPASFSAGMPVAASPNRPGRMALWAETGVSTLQARPEGIHAGIGADLQLGGRWALSVGLRYQFVRQRLVEERVGLFGQNNLDASALDTGVNVSNGLGLSYDPGPLKSHWLELPLGLQYRLGNRWQLSAGAYVGYLIKAYVPPGLQVEDNSVRVLEFSNGGVANSSSDPWYDSADARAVAPREVLPLQGGWWVSIGYRPAPRWALSIGIRQGTGSWVDAAPYQLQRSYGQASLRYYWER